MPPALPILHLDDHLIAVDKPAGLLSVSGIGPENADCVAVRVAEVHAGARIVHRLDMATSGVLVLALDAETHRRLSRQFELREVRKRYVAVVHGLVGVGDRGAHEGPHGSPVTYADEGEIDLPIRKDMERKARHLVDHVHGKPSLTRWRVIERDDGAKRTRLELRPHTGRSHQLRLHLASIGHPIIGDEIYGIPDDRAPRLLLHATELILRHPAHATELTLTSAVPF